MHVLTKELARNIEHSEIEALESRLTAIKGISGNPMGIVIEKFGNATAFSAKNIPGPSFNTVKGLSGQDIHYIDNILEFYREKDIPVRIEITPTHSSNDLFTILANKGLFQCGFHTVLYGADYKIPEISNPLITIRPLAKNEFDLFADIYTQGFKMPSLLKESIAKNNEVLHDNPSWTFCIANYQNKYVVLAVLFVHHGIGTLAASTTVPDFRGKGIHKALITKRFEKASTQNVHIVVGQAKYGSISQNNMEKLGMKVAYTKAIWESRKST